MNIRQFLWTIIKINYVVLGGASLTTPFYYKYFVDTNIIDEENINHYLTMGNILPGAMSFYMSGYIGMHLFGLVGAILGLCALIIPITLIAILTLQFISYLPFDINILLYISLPIMIIACLDYIMKIFKSDLGLSVKIILFALTFFVITFTFIGTISFLLIYIIVIFIISRKGKDAAVSAN